MNWTGVSIINCRLSPAAAPLDRTGPPVPATAAVGDLTGVDSGVEEAAVEVAAVGVADGESVMSVAEELRSVLAEKARCRRAAVVDLFRIRPFIFCNFQVN